MGLLFESATNLSGNQYSVHSDGNAEGLPSHGNKQLERVR
jgi:hypothetical protein